MKVPTAGLTVACRAVTLRKDAASWFTGKGDTESNKRHAHFVEVLEEFCESLEWRTKIPEPRDSTKQVAKVEIVEEFDVNAADKQQGEELKQLSHAYFGIFCLFRDLQNMRDFIRRTWEDYRDNKLDAMAASVVTDTVLQLARAAAEDLEQIPWPFPMSFTAEAGAQMIMYEIACEVRGCHGPSSTERDLTFHVNMADEAERCFVPTSTLLLSFVPVMEKLVVPDFKKGHWAVYNPKADRSRMLVA
jgi:hypothetical protein